MCRLYRDDVGCRVTLLCCVTLMLSCSASADQRRRDGQVMGGESDDGPPTLTLQVEVAVATRQLTAHIITIPSVFIQEMKTAHKLVTDWDLSHAQGVDGVFMVAESLGLQWELEFNFVLKVNASVILLLLVSVAVCGGGGGGGGGGLYSSVCVYVMPPPSHLYACR
jgi:hypothetical protein